MNIQENRFKQKRITIKSKITFISLIIILFIFFPIISNPLHNLSLFILQLSYFNSNDNKFINIQKFFYNNCYSEKFILFILIINYNFVNLYKTFILFTSIILSKYITGFLNLLYLKKPIFYLDDIKFSVDKFEYSFPSFIIIEYNIFFCIIYKIICRRIKKKNQKLCLKYLIIFYISLIILNEFFLGISGLDEIIFSLYISYILYYLFFNLIEVNFSNNIQFYKIIQIAMKKLIILTIIFLFFLIFIFWIKYEKEKEEELFNNLINSNKCNNNKNDKIIFSNKSLENGLLILCEIFIFMGLKFELNFTFNEEFSTWTQYNFEPQEDKFENYSIISSDLNLTLTEKISITKGAQWNHTNIMISIIRLLFLFFLTFIIFFFIKFNFNIDNVNLNIIINNLIPWCLFSLGLSLFFKKIFKFFNLVNNSINVMLRESL